MIKFIKSCITMAIVFMTLIVLALEAYAGHIHTYSSMSFNFSDIKIGYFYAIMPNWR